MSLIQSWGPYFASNVRRRGRAYHDQGRVQLEDLDNAGAVRAHVQGQQQVYTVTLCPGKGGASAECTCPAFVGEQRCKHIWATLLQMDGQESSRGRWSQEQFHPRPPKARRRAGGRRLERETEPEWSGRLSLLRPSASTRQDSQALLPIVPRQACYWVNVQLSGHKTSLVIETRQRQQTSAGWGSLKPLRIDAAIVAGFELAIDREIGALLLGAMHFVPDQIFTADSERSHDTFALQPSAQRALLQRMIETGRCFLGREGGSAAAATLPLAWDGDEAWTLWMVGQWQQDNLIVVVELRRGEQRMSIEEPSLVLDGPDGLAIYHGKAAPLDDRGASGWASQFRDEWAWRRKSRIHVPASDVSSFVQRLILLPNLPELELPDGVLPPQRHVTPTPHLELFRASTSDSPLGGPAPFTARVWFQYEDQRIVPNQPGRLLTLDNDAGLINRDLQHEDQAMALLAPLGFGANPSDEGESLVLPARFMPGAVRELVDQGWSITTDRRAVRHPSTPTVSVISDTDWFELRGAIHYGTEQGSQRIELPQILAAAKAGQHMITLDDGSQGLLPQQWLGEHELLSAIGKLEGDHLRFHPSQAALLDALLGETSQIDVDSQFQAIRDKLRRFAGINPQRETETFCGELRPYQRDGVGWMSFLRDLRMGGVLADDMGLGKTVQVLAMLEKQYGQRDTHTRTIAKKSAANQQHEHRPTLIVVPRSVVFNWIDEAQRFTPNLRVQSYTGNDRKALRADFVDHDVIVTTYGLLRRDIAELRAHQFEYVILDEAQTIKNPQSQAAKASRLLLATHRLALTGTPVENHLGDLWSIFQFLNPDMLGTGTKFAQTIRGNVVPNGTIARNRVASLQSVDLASQAGRALRPFILRRTKQQVLRDLPDKTDQMLLCFMEAEQQQVYDQLLNHYRSTLLRKARPARSGGGLGASTFMILEALLRLRQAACHPGLIDPRWANQPSAKMDTLLENLTLVVEERHKVLVFSQFTSLLALVRKRLDSMGIVYEYLDGQTRNRKERINRFQTDSDCPVFLISLKAGGLGLNLTAASYVYILDPWWNPAVEVQAIDRAHRIGQTQHVFAYRLICADTVEQRITELQEQKRKLAEAIVDGQENLLRNLTREDLERLLS